MHLSKSKCPAIFGTTPKKVSSSVTKNSAFSGPSKKLLLMSSSLAVKLKLYPLGTKFAKLNPPFRLKIPLPTLPENFSKSNLSPLNADAILKCSIGLDMNFNLIVPSSTEIFPLIFGLSSVPVTAKFPSISPVAQSTYLSKTGSKVKSASPKEIFKSNCWSRETFSSAWL